MIVMEWEFRKLQFVFFWYILTNIEILPFVTVSELKPIRGNFGTVSLSLKPKSVPGNYLLCFSGSQMTSGNPFTCLSFLQNPVHIFDHVGVNAWWFPLSSALTPTCDAYQYQTLLYLQDRGNLGHPVMRGEKKSPTDQFRFFSSQIILLGVISLHRLSWPFNKCCVTKTNTLCSLLFGRTLLFEMCSTI